jgi:hypothetical protein
MEENSKMVVFIWKFVLLGRYYNVFETRQEINCMDKGPPLLHTMSSSHARQATRFQRFHQISELDKHNNYGLVS